MSFLENEIQERLMEMEGLVYDIQGARIECQSLQSTIQTLTIQIQMLKEQAKKQAGEKIALLQGTAEKTNNSAKVHDHESSDNESMPEKVADQVTDKGTVQIRKTTAKLTQGRSECNMYKANLHQKNKLKDEPHCNPLKTLPTNRCGICHRTFRSRKRLISHRMLHYSTRPFVCQRCRQSYANIISFHSHVTSNRSILCCGGLPCA